MNGSQSIVGKTAMNTNTTATIRAVMLTSYNWWSAYNVHDGFYGISIDLQDFLRADRNGDNFVSDSAIALKTNDAGQDQSREAREKCVSDPHLMSRPEFSLVPLWSAFVHIWFYSRGYRFWNIFQNQKVFQAKMYFGKPTSCVFTHVPI